MHSALTYELLNDHEVLNHLSRDQWNSLRRVITELILATDMMRHFKLMKKFTEMYASRALPMGAFDDKMMIYKMCMKCADLGHAGKTEELHNKWSLKVVEEFFHQGDMEREQGLPISMFCDRQNVDLSSSQSDFICKIVKPLFLAVNVVVRSSAIESVIITQLDANVEFWKRRTSVAPSFLPVLQEASVKRENKTDTRLVSE